MRSGTLDAPGIRALRRGASSETVGDAATPRRARLVALRDRLLDGALALEPRRHRHRRLDARATARAGCPATRTSLVPGCEGDSLLYLLDAAGVECSTGSACQAACRSPATCCWPWACPRREARGALRLSLGHTSTDGRRRRVPRRAAGGASSGPAAPRRRPRPGRGADAGRRRDDRRGRLGRRRRPRCSTPATTWSGCTSRCRQLGRHAARERPRLLHHRGRRRRPPRRRRARHPVLRLGPGRRGSSDDVVEDFVAEYAAGRTPNPCLRCNEQIKFAALLDKARGARLRRRGTGHYAQVVERAGRRARAAPGRRHGQGPVLRPRRARRATSSPASFFPLGDTDQAARSARRPRERGLLRRRPSPTATTSASSPTATPAGWLAQPARRAARRHRRRATATCVGAARRRLRASPSASARACASDRPAADGEPRYVVAGRSRGPTRVVVGTGRPARRRRPRPATTPAGAARRRRASCAVGAQVRAHGEEVPATAWADGDAGARCASTRRIRGVAPGQSVVLYDGTRVVGLGDDQRRHDQPLTRPARTAPPGRTGRSTAGAPDAVMSGDSRDRASGR